MRFKTLECPNCGAPIKPPNGIEAFYCQHCGYHIILEDLTDAEVNASVKFGRMWHKERMRDKQYEENHAAWERTERSKHFEFVRYFIGFAVFFLFMFGVFGYEHLQSNREEARLQNTVDAIMIDIENENFSDARIKANELHYTAGWSDEIEVKWDDTREQLLKEIDKAEKETKKSQIQSIFDRFGNNSDSNDEDHGFTNSQ